MKKIFQGRLVPCGSSKGAVYLVELSENLGISAKNDKLLLTNVCNLQLFHKTAKSCIIF